MVVEYSVNHEILKDFPMLSKIDSTTSQCMVRDQRDSWSKPRHQGAGLEWSQKLFISLSQSRSQSQPLIVSSLEIETDFSESRSRKLRLTVKSLGQSLKN